MQIPPLPVSYPRLHYRRGYPKNMKNWLLFGLLGLIWGSSFLLIKIGVRELDALSFVTGRIGLATLGFVILFVVLRKRLPSDLGTLGKIAVVGLMNIALPFGLISWGETRIDSGLAGVLNATVPLFGLVFAHLALADDKITIYKIFGLLSGFIGVVVLATRSAGTGQGNPLDGQLAVLAAAGCYGFSAVYIRRTLRHVQPMVVAGGSLGFGTLIMLVATLIFVNPLPNPLALSPDVVLAVLVIGVLNTFVAYLIFYYLLDQWGASRTTMVTYLMPPISLALGVLFGSEQPDLRLIVGAVLIVGGVGFANFAQLRILFAARRADSTA